MSENALERYARSGHRQVQGWLSEIGIALILEGCRQQAEWQVHGSICEIGVHHGRLFILLHLATAPDERSVAWDLFEQQDENVDRSGKGNRQRFLENIDQHGGDLARVDAIAANSLRLRPDDVRAACGGAPRIFSVDGGHTADITAHDLALAAETVHPQGLIIVDDVFNEGWPGVAEGVCRFMASAATPLYPVAIGGNKTLFARDREAARSYQEAIAADKARFRIRTSEFFGAPVLVVRMRGQRSWLANTYRTVTGAARRRLG